MPAVTITPSQAKLAVTKNLLETLLVQGAELVENKDQIKHGFAQITRDRAAGKDVRAHNAFLMVSLDAYLPKLPPFFAMVNALRDAGMELMFFGSLEGDELKAWMDQVAEDLPFDDIFKMKRELFSHLQELGMDITPFLGLD